MYEVQIVIDGKGNSYLKHFINEYNRIERSIRNEVLLFCVCFYQTDPSE